MCVLFGTLSLLRQFLDHTNEEKKNFMTPGAACYVFLHIVLCSAAYGLIAHNQTGLF